MPVDNLLDSVAFCRAVTVRGLDRIRPEYSLELCNASLNVWMFIKVKLNTLRHVAWNPAVCKVYKNGKFHNFMQ